MAEPTWKPLSMAPPGFAEKEETHILFRGQLKSKALSQTVYVSGYMSTHGPEYMYPHRLEIDAWTYIPE